MAGIAPDEAQPGFKHILFQPYPDTRSILRNNQKRITFVDADFASDYGQIKAEWQCDGTKEMTYRITIPANTSATLRLPIEDGLYIYESGTIAEEAEGVEYIGTADGYATFEVGSGEYLFSVSNESPDGIKAIDDNRQQTTADGPVYNLSGQLLNSQWSMVNGKLSQGVVITGGKKIAIK